MKDEFGRMKILSLHRWDVSPRNAAQVQRELSARVVEKLPRRLPNDLLVAGADISYDKGSDQLYGVVVVGRMDLAASGDAAYNRMFSIVEIQRVTGRARFPYVPGFLSFREAPILLKAFARLRTRPDVLLVDGQGRAHPRRFGLACHLGVLLDIPTIGCAKSRLIGEFKDPRVGRGHCSVLRDRGETIGRVVRTQDRVKPLFVSVGHKIDLASAVRIVLVCCTRYRQPEPTRQAHREVNRMRVSAQGTYRKVRKTD